MSADPADRSEAESERLAELLRSSDASAIGAEPALTGAVEAMSLAARYFEAAAERSGDARGVVAALADFRGLMADAIGRGEPVVLRPGFQAQVAVPPRAAERDISRTRDFER